MQQLHDLAPYYWNKTESADCTLVIPVYHRRRPETGLDVVPRISFRLHRAYLCAKSTFLRGFLSGVAPLDLMKSLSPSRSKPLRIPRRQLPRILPSSASCPVVFLPVPDPSSIELLIHWMYFGNSDLIENALDKGEILWEGLVRNVEYLGLSTDIKAFLGRYYRNWLLPASCSPCPMDDEDDDDDVYDGGDENEDDDWNSDCDDDGDYSLCTPPTDDEHLHRGRTIDIKPLLHLHI